MNKTTTNNPATDVPAAGTSSDAPMSKQRTDELNHRLLDICREKDHPLTIAQQIRPLYAHWGHAYYAFISSFLTAGYTIRPFREFQPSDAHTPVLYLRHDVHQVDLPGALCMMDMERKLDIASTYYVLWDYRQSDRERRDDYLLLKKFGGDDFEYGYHECVLDKAIFELYLNGTEDPVKTQQVVNEILAEAGLDNMRPEEFFVRDDEGIWMFPEPSAIENERLRQWIVRAREILAESQITFRDTWGQGDTIHAHGGYAVVAMREFFGYLGRASYEVFEKYRDAKAGWHMFSQSFRFADATLLDQIGVRSFANQCIERATLATGHPATDVRDAMFRDSTELINLSKKGMANGYACFGLIHADVWARQHYNPLADLVLECCQPDVNLPPGQARYGMYRTALMQAAFPRFRKHYGDNWQDDPTAITAYGYGIGNFDDRARRVIALLEDTGNLDKLNGGTLIDMGGGSGTIASFLACHSSVKSYVVMDIDSEALAFQRQVYEKLGWTHCTTDETPFVEWQAPGRIADVVLSYGAFEFFYRNRDIRYVFGQVGATLKPGGVFIANVWNHHYPRQGYSRAWRIQHLPIQQLRLAAARHAKKTPNTHFRSLSHSRWRDELRRAGFDEIRILYCQRTRDEFRFNDVTRQNRCKGTHIWVIARQAIKRDIQPHISSRGSSNQL